MHRPPTRPMRGAEVSRRCEGPEDEAHQDAPCAARCGGRAPTGLRPARLLQVHRTAHRPPCAHWAWPARVSLRGGGRCLEGACYSAQCDSGVVAPRATSALGDSCGDPACGGIDCAEQVCGPGPGCVDCVSDVQCGGSGFTLAPRPSTCQCAVTELPEESCGDGVDNGCNRLTDCEDPSPCSGRTCGGNGRCPRRAPAASHSHRELGSRTAWTTTATGRWTARTRTTWATGARARGPAPRPRCASRTRRAGRLPNKPQGTQCRPAGADALRPRGYCSSDNPPCPEDGVAPVGSVCRGRASGAHVRPRGGAAG